MPRKKAKTTEASGWGEMDFSLLPKAVNDILTEHSEVYNWSEEEATSVLSSLAQVFKEETLKTPTREDERQKSCQILSTAVTMVERIVDNPFPDKIYVKAQSSLMKLLNFDDVDIQLKNQAALVLEKLLDKTGLDSDGQNVRVLACFLLAYTLDKSKTNSMKKDIKRVWALNRWVKKLNVLSEPNKGLVELLIRSVTDKEYLTSKDGRQHIGLFLGMVPSLSGRIQAEIRSAMPRLPKTASNQFGEVFYIAWNNSGFDARKAIEEGYIQDFMRRIFTLKRNGQEMGPAGKMVLSNLHFLHESRNSPQLSAAITELYSPFIWRYLTSSNDLERTSAAEVFFDAFPLEKPLDKKSESSAFWERQMKELTNLLMDDSHIVRVVAIRGVCKLLSSTPKCFTVEEMQVILKILAEDLANDTSTYVVRAAVFEGFTSIVKSPSGTILKSLLPQMSLHLHDKHPKVRRAFISVLESVKKNEAKMDLTYFEIASVKHLLARLEIDDASIGKAITKLMFDCVYEPDIPKEVFLKRLVKMIGMNLEGAKKCFSYTHGLITIADVHSIIITSLYHMRKQITSIIKENTGDDEGDKNSEKNSKESGKRKRSNEDEGDADTSASSVASQLSATCKEELPSPNTMAGILQCITVLWLTFREEINHPDNAKLLNDLYVISCHAIPTFLLYYKDTPLYYAAVYFSSLIPLSVLTPHSTVYGASMSELRKITPSSSPKQVECLVYCLCVWKRGHEILELCSDWLDVAFRSHKLNTTALEQKKKSTKVKFNVEANQPLLGLKLIEITLNHFVNLKQIVRHSYHQLVDLHCHLSRVKILIEERLSLGRELSEPELNDKFILACFDNFLKISIYLDPNILRKENDTATPQDDIPFDVVGNDLENLKWAFDHLITKLPRSSVCEETPLGAKLALAVLRNSTCLLKANRTSKQHFQKLNFLAMALLETGCGTAFLEECFKLLFTANTHCMTYVKEDDWNFFTGTGPQLYRRCLEVYKASEGIDEEGSSIAKDKKTLMAGLRCFPLALLKKYGDNDAFFKEAFCSLMSISVLLCSKEIQTEGVLESKPDVNSLPLIGREILKTILGNKVLRTHLIPSLMNYIRSFKKDPLITCGSVMLLNTLIIYSETKESFVGQNEIEDSIELAYSTLRALLESFDDHTDEDSFASNEDSKSLVEGAMNLVVQLSRKVHASIRS